MSNNVTHDIATRLGRLEGQDRQRQRTADLIWRTVLFVLGSAVTLGTIWISGVLRQPSLEETTKNLGQDTTALKPVARVVSSVETQHSVATPSGSEASVDFEAGTPVVDSVDVVEEQLDLVTSRAEKGGLLLLKGRGGRGNLAGGDMGSFRVRLTGGMQYMLVGACDQNCLDIDLRVLDPSDERTVEEDTLPDDLPVVAVTPSADTEFSVEVHMFECSADSCGWEVRVYEQRADSGVPEESG